MQAIVLHAVLIGPVPLVTELDTLVKRRILQGNSCDGPEPLSSCTVRPKSLANAPANASACDRCQAADR